MEILLVVEFQELDIMRIGMAVLFHTRLRPVIIRHAPEIGMTGR